MFHLSLVDQFGTIATWTKRRFRTLFTALSPVEGEKCTPTHKKTTKAESTQAAVLHASLLTHTHTHCSPKKFLCKLFIQLPHALLVCMENLTDKALGIETGKLQRLNGTSVFTIKVVMKIYKGDLNT